MLTSRKAKLELDEKNIYRFGMGFNSSQVGDGNITNIVIKSRYALLDLKCNKLEIRLKSFLRQLLEVVLDEINDRNGTGYTQSDIDIVFERETMTNELDNVQIRLTEEQVKQTAIGNLMNSRDVIGDEATLRGVCDILDLDYDEVKDQLKDQEEEALKDIIEKLTKEDPTNGTNGEINKTTTGTPQIGN